MSSCSVMTPINGFLNAMSCRDIGGNGPPHRDTNQSPLHNSQSVQSVRRNLFGPVNHPQNEQDLDEKLRQIDEINKNKWDFDFKKEQPIQGSRFEWEPVVSSHLLLINDPEVKDDINKNSQQLSTKLCKISDEVIANTSQSSQSVSSPSMTDSPALSSSSFLKSRPTSATISPDSQSLASSSSTTITTITGHDMNESESRVKTTMQSKQTTITAFFDGRKSAESERKRSAVQSVSHKDRQTSTPSKRHRLECTSDVAKGEDTDTTTDVTDIVTDDEDSVQTTATTGTSV